jgi:hypothetical protein
MNDSKLTTKIKIVGFLLIFTMIVNITTTTYLNKKYENSADIINTAGKQRMLTQKISKNIYYAYKLKKINDNQLNNDIIQFESNLNKLNQRKPFNTYKINMQLDKINKNWEKFKMYIDIFKEDILFGKRYYSLDNIKSNNLGLLDDINILVDLYLAEDKKQTSNLHIFQMISFLILLILIIYSITILQKTQDYMNKFLEYGKSIASGDTQELKALDIQSDKVEADVAQATTVLNGFIKKVNCAVVESHTALEHSQKASLRLEEISEEFATILDEFDSTEQTEDMIDKSEDILIESNEDLIKSTKKLQKVKEELDKLLLSCK